jgi:hypothetical protein
MSISSETKFIGISPDVSVEQKRSTQINDQSEGYTASEIIGAGLGYKVYTIMYNQTDANDPVPVILQNTLGSTPTWIRIESGTYEVTDTQFTVTKAMLFLGNNSQVSFDVDFVGNTFTLTTLDGDGISNFPMEFRVYE